MGGRSDRRLSFLEKVLGKGCWEWKGAKTMDGYGQFRSQGKEVYAHRHAYEWFYGKIPPSWNHPKPLQVAHRCDNPPCVRPDHLFLATNLENVQDAKRKGRLPRGEDHPMARLSEIDVRAIRSWYETGTVTQEKIAQEYGISRSYVTQLVRYQRWTHVRRTAGAGSS